MMFKRKAPEIQEEQDASRTSTPERNYGVNDGIGWLDRALQAAAKATHNLACGVPDRECDVVKYLQEATELIEAWQQQLQGGLPMSEPPSEHDFGRAAKMNTVWPTDMRCCVQDHLRGQTSFNLKNLFV